MSRWIIWTVAVLAGITAIAGVSLALMGRAACRAATGNGAIRGFHQFTAEQLDRGVRAHVPMGSPRAYVEGFLNGEGMKFTYDPSLNAILANAPCIKGSGIVIKSLGFTF